MSLLTPKNSLENRFAVTSFKSEAAGVVDFLKGVTMIILSLGYIGDYFSPGNSLYQPFNPGQASFDVFLKWITTYAAPVFIFLSGISAFLNGESKSRTEISKQLLKRGLLLLCAEFFVNAIGNGFNPSYPIFQLRAIWATGLSMIALSALVYLSKSAILLTGMLAIAVPAGLQILYMGEHSWLVSQFNPVELILGRCSFVINTPVLPAIGTMAIGYYVGNFYRSGFHAEIRKTALLFLGVGAIAIFFALRISDPSEDASQWSKEGNAALGILLFLDVTNHSSCILYSLITIGPGLVFLSTFEKPSNNITRQIAGFGRLSLHYLVIHIFLIHLFAESGKLMAGYVLPGLISTHQPNNVRMVKSHGFEFSNIYFLWIALVIFLYTCRRWIDRCQNNLRCIN